MNIRLRIIILLCMLSAATISWAQQTYRSRVVDSETGEPLPYASIYISKDNGALANDEGNFVVRAMPGDTLRISRIGYGTMRVTTEHLGSRVALRPMQHTLREVSVTPMTTHQILKKVLHQLKSEYNKHDKDISTYFFRTRIKGGRKTRLQEGFMIAYSAGNLRNEAVISGRRLTEGEKTEDTYLRSTNIHHLLELGPWIKSSDFWWTTVKPLSSHHIYKCKHETLVDEDGQLLYKVELSNLKKRAKIRTSGRKVITGNLYVDATTYQMKRFEGRVHGLCLTSFVLSTPTKMTFDIEYKHENGYTEVSQIHIEGGNQETTFNALLFNVARYNDPSGSKIELDGNLIDGIDAAGFDPSLWTDDIILRTKEEERILMRTREVETEDIFKSKYY